MKTRKRKLRPAENRTQSDTKSGTEGDEYRRAQLHWYVAPLLIGCLSVNASGSPYRCFAARRAGHRSAMEALPFGSALASVSGSAVQVYVFVPTHRDACFDWLGIQQKPKIAECRLVTWTPVNFFLSAYFWGGA